MSAFLCSVSHTAAGAVWAESQGLGNAYTIARTLRRLNNHALQYRYGDGPVPMVGIHNMLAKWRIGRPDHGLAAALFDCLQYQCAEGDTLELPDAAILKQIRSALIRAKACPTPGIWAI